MLCFQPLQIMHRVIPELGDGGWHELSRWGWVALA